MEKIRITGFSNGADWPRIPSYALESLICLGVDAHEAHEAIMGVHNGAVVEVTITKDVTDKSFLSHSFSFECIPNEKAKEQIEESISHSGAIGAEVGEHLRMYVLILDDVTPEYALVAASHAPIVCYWKYEDDDFMQAWKKGIIFTVICKVDRRIFERAKSEPDIVVITESRLDGREVALAFKPRPSWPKFLKFQPLWKP